MHINRSFHSSQLGGVQSYQPGGIFSFVDSCEHLLLLEGGGKSYDELIGFDLIYEGLFVFWGGLIHLTYFLYCDFLLEKVRGAAGCQLEHLLRLIEEHHAHQVFGQLYSNLILNLRFI
jgi:hypothetical protein